MEGNQFVNIILRRVLTVAVFFAFAFVLVPTAQAQDQGRKLTEVNVTDLDETTHLEFSGASKWDYDVQRPSPNQLLLKIPALSPAAQKKLAAYKDEYVKSVEVKTSGPESFLKISLSRPQIEHFDYMTDDPSLLILDLYPKPESSAKESAQAKPAPSKKNGAKKKSKKVAAAGKDEKNPRSPASEELIYVEKEDPSASLEKRFGAFDSSDSDFGRFQIKDYEIKEDAVLASKQNIYLKFPPLMMAVSRLDEWMKNQPEYVIKPGGGEETKEAQLLQNLYLRGRQAVFLKTLDYFTHKYPDSKYNEILQNLAADVYLKRWKKTGGDADYELAKDQLTHLTERYKESPLIQRNRYLLAYLLFEKGDSLAALENLQKLIQLDPQGEETPYLKLAEAECLMGLKKYDAARSVYEKMLEAYKNLPVARQAEYRLGDVAMRAENWSQADQDYAASLKTLPKSASEYPNAHFNRGEALFWEGKYKDSVEEFASFIKNFPTHPYGAYAMTRIGELFDILGANKKRVMGAYLESYFRYPDQPGAKIARILMLSHKMKDMKDKAFEKSLEEIDGLQKELPLADVNEFVTLVVSQGYEDRGDYENALNLLASFYRQHPNSPHKDTIQGRVRQDIAREIQKRSETGDYLGALKYYERFEKTWLQGSDRLDIDFYRARSYEQAGVADEALKLYTAVAARMKTLAGTPEEKQRRVSENLPSLDQVYLRMAKVLNDKRDYVTAYQNMKKIKDPQSLSAGEKIERSQLMADLWIQRGDYEDASQALDLLVEDFKDKQELLAPVLVKQAQVDNQLKRWKKALASADRALALKDVAVKLKSQAYTEKVKAQLQMGLKASAIETLQKQLDELEGKAPTEYTRYQLGELLFDQGDLSGAETVWNRLKESSSGVLWKIAEEKLKSAEFEKNYSRYIDRIPAMADQGESVEKSQ
jgi:tetratricopeptide (TPR) repeat protein